MEAAVLLSRTYKLNVNEIRNISVSTFHEAKRLSTSTPASTEEAQYSLPFATAIALTFGTIGPNEVSEQILLNRDVLRLAESIVISESDEYNQAFPQKRLAQVTITTKDKQTFQSQATEALGDSEAPFSDEYIFQKYRNCTIPLLGDSRSQDIKTGIRQLGNGEHLKN